MAQLSSVVDQPRTSNVGLAGESHSSLRLQDVSSPAYSTPGFALSGSSAPSTLHHLHNPANASAFLDTTPAISSNRSSPSSPSSSVSSKPHFIPHASSSWRPQPPFSPLHSSSPHHLSSRCSSPASSSAGVDIHLTVPTDLWTVEGAQAHSEEVFADANRSARQTGGTSASHGTAALPVGSGAHPSCRHCSSSCIHCLPPTASGATEAVVGAEEEEEEHHCPLLRSSTKTKKEEEEAPASFAETTKREEEEQHTPLKVVAEASEGSGQLQLSAEQRHWRENEARKGQSAVVDARSCGGVKGCVCFGDGSDGLGNSASFYKTASSTGTTLPPCLWSSASQVALTARRGSSESLVCEDAVNKNTTRLTVEVGLPSAPLPIRGYVPYNPYQLKRTTKALLHFTEFPFLILWVYFAYFIVIVVLAAPRARQLVWLNALVAGFLVGLGLNANAYNAIMYKGQPDIGMVIRFFCIPFGVSALSGLTNSLREDFMLVFPKQPMHLLIAVLTPASAVLSLVLMRVITLTCARVPLTWRNAALNGKVYT
eukprot:GHVS01061044.1.p1 GENE.GHVS01061044.1~~GHVS01061044.1.p1  ORF type:complete len:540 (-),score=114.08 GHVS01061044.1:849-2468(-)